MLWWKRVDSRHTSSANPEFRGKHLGMFSQDLQGCSQQLDGSHYYRDGCGWRLIVCIKNDPGRGLKCRLDVESLDRQGQLCLKKLLHTEGKPIWIC